MQAACESLVWGEKEGSEKGATLVSWHRLGTGSVYNQRAPLVQSMAAWQRAAVAGRVALSSAAASPRHLRLELAGEQTGMLLRAPAWPWSGTRVLERWVGPFSLVCSHWVELWLGPSQCWVLLMASGFFTVSVHKEK